MAKTALDQSLPACLAKWLNAAGISSEHREELAVVVAVGAIAYGSHALRKDLREMAIEKRALEAAKQQPQKLNDGHQATN